MCPGIFLCVKGVRDLKRKIFSLEMFPDQGKEVESFRRPATVIGTKAAVMPLSQRDGKAR